MDVIVVGLSGNADSSRCFAVAVIYVARSLESRVTRFSTSFNSLAASMISALSVADSLR